MSKEWRGTGLLPDRLTMTIGGLTEVDAQFLAQEALTLSRQMAPKMSGRGAAGLTAVWGEGFFGVRWADDHIWYQEVGIKPFTMTSSSTGKIIPMWIDDPTGTERAKNPRARTRTTVSGKTQVLIFRKMAPPGARKTVSRTRAGVTTQVSVPRSYPGAPGRISTREARRPWTSPGRVGGAIARRNVGVRWRHPGMLKKSFIRQGLIMAASYHGFPLGAVRDSNGRFR